LNSFHGLLNVSSCMLGGYVRIAITCPLSTQYKSHLFHNSFMHVLYSVLSGQCTRVINVYIVVAV